MSRHSKNNTALAFFTHAEKAKLNYGTQKECIYENILAQKKEIARLQKLADAQKLHIEQVRTQEEIEKEEAELERFEKMQTHFLPEEDLNVPQDVKVVGGKVYKAVKTMRGTVYTPDRKTNEELAISQDAEALRTLQKKMVKFHTQPVSRAQQHNNSSAIGQLEGRTPAEFLDSAAPEIIKAPKNEIMCTASDEPHPITLKKLVPVKFTEAKGKKEEYICPSCTKTFTNGSKIIVLKGCGHALCKECCGRFVKTSNRCFVCETKCKDRDLVTLKGEGTGFAGGGGKVETSKTTVAFQ
ncbi:hypothetical protein HK104_010093 [Borealophlyctis nickersoniae]|nr:hypothetical protein HK104_010093 [Borealophlyctis nickersoniae]